MYLEDKVLEYQINGLAVTTFLLNWFSPAKDVNYCILTLLEIDDFQDVKTLCIMLPLFIIFEKIIKRCTNCELHYIHGRFIRLIYLFCMMFLIIDDPFDALCVAFNVLQMPFIDPNFVKHLLKRIHKIKVGVTDQSFWEIILYFYYKKWIILQIIISLTMIDDPEEVFLFIVTITIVILAINEGIPFENYRSCIKFEEMRIWMTFLYYLSLGILLISDFTDIGGFLAQIGTWFLFRTARNAAIAIVNE